MGLSGTFAPPGDKSISHRLALFSLLGRGRMEVSNFSPCADAAASLAAARLLGAELEEGGETLTITGAEGRVAPQAEIDCANSGTTIRLLMGLLAGVAGRHVLHGDKSLHRRPMERVARPLRLMGAGVETNGGTPPVTVRGGALRGIDYRLPMASAQLKTALLLAGLQARGRTRLAEPGPSRDHTENLFQAWGARLTREGPVLELEPSGLDLPARFRVPGDASSAAFFIIAAAIIPGSRVEAENVLLNPTRTGFLQVLRRMGARVEVSREGEEPEPWGRIRVSHGPGLKGCRIQGRELPLLLDEVPILALAASQASGRTIFEEAGELRHKESDRLTAVATQLRALGGRVVIKGDDLIVQGPTRLQPAEELDSFGDHRMAMTLRLAALLAGGEPRIKGEESAAVSYPGFGEELKRLLG